MGNMRWGVLLVACLAFPAIANGQPSRDPRAAHEQKTAGQLRDEFRATCTDPSRKFEGPSYATRLKELGAAAVPMFAELMREDCFEAVHYSAMSLGELNTDAALQALKDAYEFLIQEKSSKKRGHVKHIIRALGSMENPEATTFLTSLRKEQSSEARMFIAEQLYVKKIHRKWAEDALLELAKLHHGAGRILNSHPEIFATRRADALETASAILADHSAGRIGGPLYPALVMLQKLGGDDSVQALMQGYRAQKDAVARTAIIRSIGAISEPSSAVALNELLDETKSVMLKELISSEIAKKSAQ